MSSELATDLRSLLTTAIGNPPGAPALLLADRGSALARALADGYRQARPDAACLDVDLVPEAEVRATIDALPQGALVVLVATSRFDLGEVRFRLALFRRGLAVVEHPHLGRVPDDEIPRYLASLAYDPDRFRGVGRAIQTRVDAASRIEITTPEGRAEWRGPFEPARLNVGDYAEMANIGGQFPIGEAFTEPVDLEALNGTLGLFAYGAADFSVAFVEPFALVLERGRVVGAPGAPADFLTILDAIRADEGEVWVRELGFGLNPALTATERLSDVSAYERMTGVHLSLGAKHSVYPKAQFKKKVVRYHVDVFVHAPQVRIGDELVFDAGRWLVG